MAIGRCFVWLAASSSSSVTLGTDRSLGDGSGKSFDAGDTPFGATLAASCSIGEMQNSCHGHSTVSQCVPNETPKGPWPLFDAPLGIQMADVVLDPGARGWRHRPRMCHRCGCEASSTTHVYTYTRTSTERRRVWQTLTHAPYRRIVFPSFDIVCSAVGHRHSGSCTGTGTAVTSTSILLPIPWESW